MRVVARSGSNWLASAVCALAIGACYCVGQWDQHCVQLKAWQLLNPIEFESGRFRKLSWLWLLLPITLTTAFVMYGAWRSAVRDREQGDVEEVVA